jgi:hypothetical protein
VAAWLSEKVLRGRGPDASGFESHRRGRIFSKEGTSARPWMCVYVYQGLTVGWWKEESTLFRPPPRGQHGFESRREGCPWVYKCCVCLNVRWNGRGWPGKVPRSPVASPIGKGTRKMNWKNGRPKGTVKAVWQKTGMAI